MVLDTVFVVCAVVGGALFLVQLAMQFLGAGADVDLDAQTGHASADMSFKVLSLQGLTSFLMMFGLVGLATLRAADAPSPPVALGAGLLGGAATTWLVAKLFQLAQSLQSSGTLDMSRLVGAPGSVYLTIGPNKPGKVTITINNRLLTLQGVVEGDGVLETGTSIRVKRVVQDDMVLVERA